MGDKGRSNVDYDADLEVGAPAPMARRLSSRQGRLGDKGRSNVYYDADLEVGAPALPGGRHGRADFLVGRVG